MITPPLFRVDTKCWPPYTALVIDWCLPPDPRPTNIQGYRTNIYDIRNNRYTSNILIPYSQQLIQTVYVNRVRYSVRDGTVYRMLE